MTSFKDISVKRKLWILCGILLALTVIATYSGSVKMLEQKILADDRFTAVRLYTDFMTERVLLRDYVLMGEENSLSELLDREAQFRERFDSIQSLNDRDLTQMFSKMRSDELQWHQTVASPMIEFRKQYDIGKLTFEDLSNKFVEIRKDSSSDDVRQTRINLEQLLEQKIDENVSNSLQVLAGILSIEIAIGAILTILISKTIVNPLKRLQEAAAIASNGDLTVQMHSEDKDEVGKTTSSFGNMTEGLRKIVANIQTAATDVSSSSQQISSSTEQMSASTQQISSTIQQIAKGSQNQAQLVEDANKSLDKLGSAMKNLGSKAQSTSEISENMKKIAESSGKYATDASNKLARITSVSEESVEKIKRLVERSAQITSVLDVIRKIAEQTNLLSLNAAIEAARAGESGRGFAVVADEVRRLAESSAKATEEIELQIKQIQEEAQTTVRSIEEGTKDVLEGRQTIGKGLEALEYIAKNVQETASNINTVTSLVQEQVSELDLIRKSISDIASFAEESASGTEETASAMEEHAAAMEEIASGTQNLGNLSEELLEIVKRFKLPEQYLTHEKQSLTHMKQPAQPKQIKHMVLGK